MTGKLRKILRLYKSRKRVRAYIDADLANDRLDSILSAYDIQSLPDVSIKDLFSLYNYDNSKENVVIKSDFSEGASPVNDYYVLCNLASAKKIKEYFEIGTWVGLSACNVSDTLKDKVNVYTLDIPENHRDIELYGIPYEIFGHYSKNKPNILHLKGDSKNFDFSSFYKKIELVFIDGNHSYEYVKNDSKVALKLLKDDSSIIAWHDYILCGELNKNVLCGILDAIPAAEHRHLIHIYQSNLALYSRTFNFEFRKFPKWNIPDANYNILFKLTDS